MLTGRTAFFLGAVGAVVGALVGFWGVGVLAQQGFHAIVLPAGLPGILGGAIARKRSLVWAIGCGVFGLVAGIATEWKYRPFIADRSLSYFVTHIFDVTPMVLGVIAVGSIIGGWFAFSIGRRSR